ncbi:MAG: hypothetical protein MHM6MM_003445 [Cercozoa sp. M6MM]
MSEKSKRSSFQKLLGFTLACSLAASGVLLVSTTLAAFPSEVEAQSVSEPHRYGAAPIEYSGVERVKLPMQNEAQLLQTQNVDGYGMPIGLPPSDFAYVRDLRLQDNEVLLTIDDGPSGSWATHTSEILDILAASNVRANFFLIGRNVDASPAEALRMATEGHEIGVHTMTHPDMTKISSAQRFDEIFLCLDSIQRAVPGYMPRYWRPPYGGTSTLVRDEVFNNFGLAQTLWTLDTLDWDPNMKGDVIAAQLQGAKGHIALVHDGASNSAETVKALRIAVPQLVTAGAKFVTLSELDMRAAGWNTPPTTTTPTPTPDPVLLQRIQELENALIAITNTATGALTQT